MSARDDYPEAGTHPAQYDQMCDEIDHLRAEVVRLRGMATPHLEPFGRA